MKIDDAITHKQVVVNTALIIDESLVGVRGVQNLHYALEAACSAAAESFMRTHQGVVSWVALAERETVEGTE